MIYINAKFKAVDVKVQKAKDETAKFCDLNNFSLVNFKDQEVKAMATDKQTAYMVKKAVELGAKEVK